MVEVVVNGGNGRRMEEFSKDVKEILNNNGRNDGGVDIIASEPPVNYSAGRWESFLPKMKLRVLLVEADDSTRQIITALLRKCSYRVAAVADGLKAWEVLKVRPQNIDLILTEVDLPSISGFALLTLIMEHRICKNIPVIMMSSEDSVSTVYKCMLRGAADFLVKPVRKNELRNLWQHVWRRQASGSSGPGPPDESVAQQKVEATAENNAVSISSSDDVACIQRSREGIEKGTDAQSSSTKPELEDEGEGEGWVQGLSHSKRIMPLSNKGILTKTEHKNMTKEVQHHHVVAEGSRVTTGMDASKNFQEDTKSNDHWRRFNSSNQACGDSHALMPSSQEAIDLIGAFDNHLKCINGSISSNAGINKFESLPLLDLSLRRSPPCGSVNQVADERPRLNHSDSSAFSRYVSKTLRPGFLTSPIACNQPDNQEADSDNQIFNYTLNRNSDPCGRDISPPRPTPLSSEQLECSLSPVPIPVRGLRFQNISNAYGSLIPPAFYTPSSMSQLQSPTLVSHQEGSFQVSFNPLNHVIRDQQPSCNPASQNVDDASDKNENKYNNQGFETAEETGHLSSVIDQSPTSGFCNNPATHLQNLGHCSDGKLEPLSSAEYGNEEAFRVHDGESVRSMQREAALMKFRLKRKERCFEKKVRYESRKKLAEKRPRVKGQFVRQVSNEPPAERSS